MTCRISPENTYTPEPSRPCSPEMVCLYNCQFRWVFVSRTAEKKKSRSRGKHTRKQHRFGYPNPKLATVTRSERQRYLRIGRSGDEPRDCKKTWSASWPLLKWWWGNSGGACAMETRPDVCLEGVGRLTISRILT